MIPAFSNHDLHIPNLWSLVSQPHDPSVLAAEVAPHKRIQNLYPEYDPTKCSDLIILGLKPTTSAAEIQVGKCRELPATHNSFHLKRIFLQKIIKETNSNVFTTEFTYDGVKLNTESSSDGLVKYYTYENDLITFIETKEGTTTKREMPLQ